MIHYDTQKKMWSIVEHDSDNVMEITFRLALTEEGNADHPAVIELMDDLAFAMGQGFRGRKGRFAAINTSRFVVNASVVDVCTEI